MDIDISGLSECIRTKILDLSSSVKFERIITKGANGHVLIGHNLVSSQKIVLKFYYWGGGDHAEPALLANLSSRHILKVLHAESLTGDDAFFITPYCQHGDLDDALAQRKFGPVEAIDIVHQVAAGTSFLHGSGYIHRDLKPTNVFILDNLHFVIGDFGSVVAQNEHGYSLSLTRHSLLYRPPEEIVEKKSYKEGDIYQLGIMLYQLLGGNLPYHEAEWLNAKQKLEYDTLGLQDKQFFATNIIEGRIKQGRILDLKTLPPWTPNKLIKVIKQCCNIDRTRRFASASDFAARLNNLRPEMPDWRIAEHPVLMRKNRTIRIVQAGSGLHIETNVKAGWRRNRALRPNNLKEAVIAAEGIQ